MTERNIETMPRAATVAIMLYMAGYRLPPVWQHHEFKCVGDPITGDPCQCGYDGEAFVAEVGYLNHHTYRYGPNKMQDPKVHTEKFRDRLWIYDYCPVNSKGQPNIVCLHHAQKALRDTLTLAPVRRDETPCIKFFNVLQYLAGYEELVRQLGLSDDKGDDEPDCDNCEADVEGRVCDDCIDDDEPTEEITTDDNPTK